ncbi:hypothetical protein PIB30_065299 [Stylosanthes scabra]|uniref:Uncharacterized protein n=1 Tax=Stylosanthes scabra TaxID=79078 RepID=A0ABU6SM23_9FABA|nr:hypothetical protein [Stylosanthes scabra]
MCTHCLAYAYGSAPLCVLPKIDGQFHSDPSLLKPEMLEQTNQGIERNGKRIQWLNRNGLVEPGPVGSIEIIDGPVSLAMVVYSVKGQEDRNSEED